MIRFKRDTMVIVVSDIHIGNEFSRLYEFTAFLKDLLVMKIYNNLPFLRGLIILGDLFDLNATSYEDLCSNNQYFGIYTLLYELKNNDVSIILSLGNQEISTSGFYNLKFTRRKEKFIELFKENFFSYFFLTKEDLCNISF